MEDLTPFSCRPIARQSLCSNQARMADFTLSTVKFIVFKYNVEELIRLLNFLERAVDLIFCNVYSTACRLCILDNDSEFYLLP